MAILLLDVDVGREVRHVAEHSLHYGVYRQVGLGDDGFCLLHLSHCGLSCHRHEQSYEVSNLCQQRTEVVAMGHFYWDIDCCTHTVCFYVFAAKIQLFRKSRKVSLRNCQLSKYPFVSICQRTPEPKAEPNLFELC